MINSPPQFLPDDISKSLMKAYREEGFRVGNLASITLTQELSDQFPGFDWTFWLPNYVSSTIFTKTDLSYYGNQFKFNYNDGSESMWYSIEDHNPPFVSNNSPMDDFQLRNKLDSIELLITNLTIRLEVMESSVNINSDLEISNLTYRLSELEEIVNATTAGEVAKLVVE